MDSSHEPRWPRGVILAVAAVGAWYGATYIYLKHYVPYLINTSPALPELTLPTPVPVPVKTPTIVAATSTPSAESITESFSCTVDLSEMGLDFDGTESEEESASLSKTESAGFVANSSESLHEILDSVDPIASRRSSRRSIPNQVDSVGSIPNTVDSLGTIPNRVDSAGSIPNTVDSLDVIPSVTASLGSIADSVDQLPKSDVVLYQIRRGYNTPSMSTFPFELETFLRVARIRYEIGSLDYAYNFGAAAPHDSFETYLKIDGRDINEDCIAELIATFGIDLESGATKARKTMCRFIASTLKEKIYCGIMLWRWVLDEGRSIHQIVPLTYNEFFGLKSVAKRIEASLKKSDKSTQDIIDGVLEALEDISAALGANEFLLGEKPGLVDCQAFALFSQMIWNMPGSPFEVGIKKHSNIMDFAWRMKKTYWPDWNSLLQERVLLQYNGLQAVEWTADANSNYEGSIDNDKQPDKIIPQDIHHDTLKYEDLRREQQMVYLAKKIQGGEQLSQDEIQFWSLRFEAYKATTLLRLRVPQMSQNQNEDYLQYQSAYAYPSGGRFSNNDCYYYQNFQNPYQQPYQHQQAQIQRPFSAYYNNGPGGYSGQVDR